MKFMWYFTYASLADTFSCLSARKYIYSSCFKLSEKVNFYLDKNVDLLICCVTGDTWWNSMQGCKLGCLRISVFGC